MGEETVVDSIVRVLDLFEGGGFGFGEGSDFDVILANFHF